MQLSGSWTAILTPFNQKGKVDIPALENLVEWQISEGIDGIVCCGSTGEAACLEISEKKKVLEACLRSAQKKVPIVMGTGTHDTRQSVKLTEAALKLGADGCMAVTPYYNKPTQKGCILHFGEIAKVGLPLIVYMNPPRTGIKLTVETIQELSGIPNIVALKDSNHDLELFKKMRPFFPIFSGDDDFTFELMKEGAVGSIGVISNVIPRGWSQMISRCRKKNWDGAKLVFEKYMTLYRSIFREPNPVGIKFAASLRGLCNPFYRLPLLPPEIVTQKEIKKALLGLALPQFVKDLKSPL